MAGSATVFTRAGGAFLLMALSLPVQIAHAQAGWVAHEAEATATLPQAQPAGPIADASLSCAARRWTLTLDTGDARNLAGDAATLRIDGRSFEARLAVRPDALAIHVPREALEPLKRGLRFTIAFAGPLAQRFGEVAFSLRGSNAAITAIEERCTQRDMSRYGPVTFTPYSSYVNLARELRADDIAAFTAATTAQPALEVAMAEFGGDRRVLFTRLCGSSWYYGRSGCNITGFAPVQPSDEEESEAARWRVVYDTENALLYTDPSSAAGWRDLVTLPVQETGQGRVWRWDGSTYTLHGDLPDDDDAPLPLRAGHD